MSAVATAKCTGSNGIPDDTVGTLAQFLGHIVPLVDNELLIEDLEHFAALEVRHGG
jgi:hypothetical protein